MIVVRPAYVMTFQAMISHWADEALILAFAMMRGRRLHGEKLAIEVAIVHDFGRYRE